MESDSILFHFPVNFAPAADEGIVSEIKQIQA
jgi:hypothetical protein